MYAMKAIGSMNTVPLRINEMNFRCQTCDLAADNEVNIEVESVCFESRAITFLHRAHLVPDVARSFIQGLGVHDRLPRRLIVRQNQIVIDECKRCLSERKVA